MHKRILVATMMVIWSSSFLTLFAPKQDYNVIKFVMLVLGTIAILIVFILTFNNMQYFITLKLSYDKKNDYKASFTDIFTLVRIYTFLVLYLLLVITDFLIIFISIVGFL